MEYFVGVALALGAGLFTTVAGFDRDRSLYPAILIVIASYYDLFAVMGGGAALVLETGAFAVFFGAAVIGFRTSLWVVVVALVGHGLFDWYHGQWIENAGVPAWWPTWCLSYDVAAGAYLAWRLLSGKIDATNPSSFGKRIHPYVEAELAAAKAADLGGDPDKAFSHLQRAHLLGQRSTVQHVRVHVRMLIWGIRHNHQREVIGQILRVIGAAAGTWVGFVPQGNTGGANISGFKPMAIPADLAGQIAAARTSGANAQGLGAV
jgi:Protein of unknown function (DUF3703)